MDLKKLTDFFSAGDIEFRVGTANQTKTKGIALPYVTSRAIQNRLDEVCGPENWKNEFAEWKDNHQLCGISIRINNEWITKWDGADDTNFEGTKGGLSSAMKRAAVQWGIGRYLYEVPVIWTDIVPLGKNGYKFKNTPMLPEEFLPLNDAGISNAPVATSDENALDDIIPKNQKISAKEKKKVEELIERFELDLSKILAWARIDKLEDMTTEAFNMYISMLDKKFKGVRFEITELEGDTQ